MAVIERDKEGEEAQGGGRRERGGGQRGGDREVGRRRRRTRKCRKRFEIQRLVSQIPKTADLHVYVPQQIFLRGTAGKEAAKSEIFDFGTQGQ